MMGCSRRGQYQAAWNELNVERTDAVCELSELMLKGTTRRLSLSPEVRRKHQHNEFQENTVRWLTNPWKPKAWSRNSSLNDELPEKLGRYEPLALIGEGGMASIYLARLMGPAGFEKPVALKIIHRHLRNDEHFLTMLIEEAAITSRLQHPNIVQLFELDEVDDIFFVVMELILGEPLRKVAARLSKSRDKRLDMRMAYHIVSQVGEGLHFAHELTDFDGRPLGIVHRDVSPQNLLVTYSGSVKLLDFGIAKALSSTLGTRPGIIKGKSSYMSPEQVLGQRLDRRSDLFTLGSVFWELLAGRPLFRAKARPDTLERVLKASVPPISMIRDDVPRQLDQILARALSRRPRDRYPDVATFLYELKMVMAPFGGAYSTGELATFMQRAFELERHKKSAFLAETIGKRESQRPTLPEDAETRPMIAFTMDQLNAYQGTDTEVDAFSLTFEERSLTDETPSIFSQMLKKFSIVSTDYRRYPMIAAISSLVVAIGVVIGAIVSFAVGDFPIGFEENQETPSAISTLWTQGVIVDSEANSEAPSVVVSPVDVGEGEETENTGDTEGVTHDTETVAIDVVTNPQGAAVFFNGELQPEHRQHQVPRSNEPIRVRVAANGFEDFYFTIIPNRAQSRVARLRPRRRRAKRARDNVSSSITKSTSPTNRPDENSRPESSADSAHEESVPL